MKTQGFLTASIVAMTLSHAPAAAGRNSDAVIAAAFSDSCRAFVARSSKDISHVDLYYLDGRVVKDETIGAPGYAVDGDPGDELEAAIVKAGTTSTLFECGMQNRAPVARLEIATPADRTIEGCFDFFAGGLICEQSTPRTDWTSADQVPDTGGDASGIFHWACGSRTDFSQCPFTFNFRGIGSSDLDGDIVLWSLDFGDGTSAGGSWDAEPPGNIAHEYTRDACGSICVITLTVTDSTGQSGSSSIRMGFVDLTPD